MFWGYFKTNKIPFEIGHPKTLTEDQSWEGISPPISMPDSNESFLIGKVQGSFNALILNGTISDKRNIKRLIILVKRNKYKNTIIQIMVWNENVIYYT